MDRVNDAVNIAVLRTLLDKYANVRGYVGSIARGERVTEQHFDSALKKLSLLLCGDQYDLATRRAIALEYHNRKRQKRKAHA